MLNNSAKQGPGSSAGRLAVIDTNFPWKQSGFRYWENVEIWKQRPDTLFFATKLYYDDFPAKVHDIRSFGAMAEKEGITDVYCVFLNHLLSLLGEIKSSNGFMMPGANPLVSIRREIEDLGIRVHATLYPGGGLMPGTKKEFLDIAGRHCETVFTNIQEVRESIPKSVYMPVVINTDFYTITPKEKTAPLQITFCTYKAVRKNFPLLADIFNRLDDRFHLNIIGDWGLELHLLKNSNYTFYEKLNPEQIKEVYEKTHIFLYCGIADPFTLDGFPVTSACDAMAAGCLLVTTNPRNDHSILANQKEYIETADSAESFVEILNWAYANYEDAMKIAETGSKKIREHFNAADIVGRKLNYIFGSSQEKRVEPIEVIGDTDSPVLSRIQTFGKIMSADSGNSFSQKRVLFAHSIHGGTYKVISQGIIDGFRKQGLEVFEIQPKENAADIAAELKPNLLFVLLGDSFPVHQVRLIAEMGIKTAVWFTDDPYYTDVMLKLAPYYEYIFTQEKSCVPHYQMTGCKHVHYLPLGVNTQYFNHEEGVSFKYDVCFLGTAWKSRLDMFDELAPYLADKKAVIAGPGWKEMKQYNLLAEKVRIEVLSPNESAQLMRESKIVINHHRPHDDDTFFHKNSRKLPALSINPRTFEVCACGAFQLTDVRDELSRFYKIGSEIDIYSSPAELSAKIEYYLEHEEERLQIAKSGHKKTINNHSYRQRVKNIWNLVFPEEKLGDAPLPAESISIRCRKATNIGSEAGQLEWNYNKTSFLADTMPELPAHFMKNGPWSGHRQFAYDLVQNLKPETIVELGTHYGTSFFSFCQAVRDAGLASTCYAVDNWKGDPHAGYYGEGVYQAVSKVNSREFPQIGNLIRSTFDGAVPLFADETIDLLHIDGYHTYEAVSHDYHTWIGKLKKGAPVLFHDTAVRIKDYNVHQFWEELCAEFPFIHFSHCNGLGVLFPKGVPESLEGVLREKEELIDYYERF